MCGRDLARRVLAVVHCFYIDVAEAILTRMADPSMAAAGAQFVFALTTDSADKAKTLRDLVTRLGLTAELANTPDKALREADLSPGDIVHVNAHATATPQGDVTEAMRVLPRASFQTICPGTWTACRSDVRFSSRDCTP